MVTSESVERERTLTLMSVHRPTAHVSVVSVPGSGGISVTHATSCDMVVVLWHWRVSEYSQISENLHPTDCPGGISLNRLPT